ncbi:hypothetical protein ACSDR0_46780 [Streptosporangium sp. G11]|uniref:hypothetical protein n=1 Tax=Streptosporangium sp. G11 TaxID=3436926 RepID=UPI003EBEE36A
MKPDMSKWLLQWLSDPEAGFGVGVHRFIGRPRSPPPGERMFTFIGYDVLEGAGAQA